MMMTTASSASLLCKEKREKELRKFFLFNFLTFSCERVLFCIILLAGVLQEVLNKIKENKKMYLSEESCGVS